MTLRTISINGADFFSFHGVFPEEKLIGNWYTVDISVDLILKEDLKDSLSETLDYSLLYSIVKSNMKQSVDLLETIIERMEHELTNYQIEQSTITIQKKNPPLGAQILSSSVRSVKKY